MYIMLLMSASSPFTRVSRCTPSDFVSGAAAPVAMSVVPDGGVAGSPPEHARTNAHGERERAVRDIGPPRSGRYSTERPAGALVSGSGGRGAAFVNGAAPLVG